MTEQPLDGAGKTPDAEKPPLQEPKKPVKKISTRRDLAPNLNKPMNPGVQKVIHDRSKVTVTNIKLLRAVTPHVQAGTLADREKDQNRKLAALINNSLGEVKKKRKTIKDSSGPRKSVKSELTAKGKNESVSEGFKDFISEGGRGLAMPLGQFGGQVSTRVGEVSAINPGVKVGDQALQLLGHFSQIFMNKVNDMEYQSMLVNDRVFVASNAQATIKKFAGEFVQDYLAAAAKTIVPDTAPSAQGRAYKIGAVAEAFKMDVDSTAPLNQQQQDGAKMLAEYDVGYHTDHDARPQLESALNFLQHQATNRLAMQGPFDALAAADYVAKAGYEYAVIGVHPKTATGWHAEQALALTLITSGWSGSASVAGTKLPCFTCWLTLGLLSQYGFDINFTPSPGYIWETNTVPGLTHVAKALGVKTVSELVDRFKLTENLTGGQFKQFMTALQTQADIAVDVSIGGAALKARHLTQDQSQRSFYFPQVAPTETEITGAPYPDVVPSSPVGTYGTPPTSPGGQQDLDDQMDYETREAEYKKLDAEYQKQQLAKAEAAKKLAEAEAAEKAEGEKLGE